MWRVQFARCGSPADVVEVVQVPPPPPPGAGEALVRVLAFPIHSRDLEALAGRDASGRDFPCGLGTEAVGVVEAVGPEVSRVAPGDRVLLLCRDTWVEHRCLPQPRLIPVSRDIDLLQAAMLTVGPALAAFLLDAFVRLVPGAWIVQNAADSAVGRYVAQLARLRGVGVVSIVRQPRRSPDAGEVFVGEGPDLARRVRAALGGAECVLALDAIGGRATASLADCLVDGAMVVVYGELDGAPCLLRPDQAVARGLQRHGFALGPRLRAAPLDELDTLYGRLAALAAAGDLQARVTALYAVSEIRQALIHAARPGRNGKILCGG